VRLLLLSALLGVCSLAGAAPFVPLPPSAIEAVQLTVTRQDGAGSAETEQTYFMRRPGDDPAQPLGPEPGAVLSGVLAAARPALGWQSCGQDPAGDGQAPLFLAVELRVWIKGQQPIRLRSDSRCALMLPWHITDGRRLSVLNQPGAGRALMGLIQAWCHACLPEWGQAPPAAPAPAANGDVAHHYAALLAAWRRLGRRQGATSIKIATLPLTDALDWMDHDRFERLLRATAKSRDSELAALAADLIRTLQVARWGYIDRQGKWLLPRRFEKAAPFAAGLAWVRVDGGWRQIARDGRERASAGAALAPPPSGAASTAPAPPLAVQCEDGQPASLIRPYAEGRAAVRCDSLWGYVDRDGRFVIRPRYLEAGDFSEGRAAVR